MIICNRNCMNLALAVLDYPRHIVFKIKVTTIKLPFLPFDVLCALDINSSSISN